MHQSGKSVHQSESAKNHPKKAKKNMQKKHFWTCSGFLKRCTDFPDWFPTGSRLVPDLLKPVQIWEIWCQIFNDLERQKNQLFRVENRLGWNPTFAVRRLDGGRNYVFNGHWIFFWLLTSFAPKAKIAAPNLEDLRSFCPCWSNFGTANRIWKHQPKHQFYAIWAPHFHPIFISANPFSIFQHLAVHRPPPPHKLTF